MTRFSRSLVASAAFSLAALIFGCAEDNEKPAALKGEASKDTAPAETRYAQQQKVGGMGNMTGTGYPGAPKAKATDAPAK